MIAPTFAVALLFVAVHLFIGRVHFLDALSRRSLMSFSGGVAVSYVFSHVLPEMAAHHRLIDEEGWVTNTTYLVALAGVVVFYGLEIAVRAHPRESHPTSGQDVPALPSFWLHVVLFFLLNVLIGYLLIRREEEGYWNLALYSTAIGLHFIGIDHALREDHKVRYDRFARWILSGGAMVGWLVGVYLALPASVLAMLFAFLSGAIVLNALKEELPSDAEGRFLPFAFGAVLLALLTLAAP